MLRTCVRVVLLGLLAAVSATAQNAVFVDLTGRPADFDLVTLVVQTQVEAVVPVVNSFGNPDLASLGNAWVEKYHKAVMTGTMTVQQNADNLNTFLSGAGALSPTYATNLKAAISKSRLEFFKFHEFMPAATWDVVEFGIAQSKVKFNTNRLMQTRMLIMAGFNSQSIMNLQLILNNYLNTEEQQNPGFIKAVSKALEAALKNVWVSNPTRAPTVPPTTKVLIGVRALEGEFESECIPNLDPGSLYLLPPVLSGFLSSSGPPSTNSTACMYCMQYTYAIMYTSNVY